MSSSVIFLSVLNFDRSGAGGAVNRVSPFFVMAVVKEVSVRFQFSEAERKTRYTTSRDWSRYHE